MKVKESWKVLVLCDSVQKLIFYGDGGVFHPPPYRKGHDLYGKDVFFQGGALNFFAAHAPILHHPGLNLQFAPDTNYTFWSENI